MSNNQVIERLENSGFDNLTTSDQIGLTLELIGYTGKLPPFQSLDQLFTAHDTALEKYFDTTQIAKIRSIPRLSSAWLLEKINATPLFRCSSPADAEKFFQQRLCGENIEKFGVLFMNTRNVFIDYEVLSVGSINRAPVFPGKIAKTALLKDSAAVIVGHNHPSGDPTPSAQDLALTTAIGSALKTLDIDLLDHVIVGGQKTFSFSENNLDLVQPSKGLGIEF